MTIKVGFIGVGQMGRPMVDRLVAANVPIEVFVRRPELRSELETAGVSVADSPTELAARSELLILCCFNDAQVREIMLDDGVLSSMAPGSVLVSHVTGSPELPRELQDAAPVGVTVLDVPISGTQDNIRAGQLTMMVGGDSDAVTRVRPVLAAYGDPIIEVGGLGDGQRIKLINNLLFTVNLRVALEAATLAESMGVPAAEMSRVVAECSGDSYAVRLLQHMTSEMIDIGAKPYLQKDVAVIRDVAAAEGIDLGGLGELAGWVDGD